MTKKAENLKNADTPSLNIAGVSNRLFSINTVLHTRDGRIIGNAIIIGHEDKFNVIKTDYGHTVRFTDAEIDECFYIAYSDLTDEEKQYMRETIGDHKHSIQIVANGTGIAKVRA